jgi:hypothetical protein
MLMPTASPFDEAAGSCDLLLQSLEFSEQLRPAISTCIGVFVRMHSTGHTSTHCGVVEMPNAFGAARRARSRK